MLCISHTFAYSHPVTEDIQLLLKSLNTPADLLSQLCQSISLISRLYAYSASTILIASVQKR